jgi:hypothetical protein
MSKFQNVLVMRSSQKDLFRELKLDWKLKELIQEILELGSSGVFPNIPIALRFFVSLPASLASGERSFNVFKQVKNCYR